VSDQNLRDEAHAVTVSFTVPGEPRRVRLEAINSTAVRVQWRPPLEREQNGVIRGYQVLYLRLGDREEGIGRTRVYDVMDGECSLFYLSVSAFSALTCLFGCCVDQELIFLYGAETRSRTIDALINWCLGCILNIHWSESVTHQ